VAHSSAQEDFDFSSLSLKDLMEVRDLYHFHLMNKANVVGTAVGLYLIRKTDPWPTAVGQDAAPTPPKKRKKKPRTFNESEVRAYSWPCIIVLVREWVDEEDIGKKGKLPAWDAIPKRLYLPDARMVPVCTVLAPAKPLATGTGNQPMRWPQATLGGGLPVRVEVQHEEHVATLGCLVTDGHTTYGLTARHACGEPGTPVAVQLRGGYATVGRSTKLQITRRQFSEVYPGLPIRQTWLALDVGLIRVDDVRDWTPNVYGLPRIKPLFDFYEQGLSLRKLMDKPVVAVGAASGLLQGRIKALFYRFKSVGGYDYVSDFLIAPQKGQSGTRPGDSGAIWHLQMPKNGKEDKGPLQERDLRPLAVEWGAQALGDTNPRSHFSLATALSNVCKLLDVELVVDGDNGVKGVWGAAGHYSIGSLAIDLVKDKALKEFLQANADLISLPLDRLDTEPKEKVLLESGFVQLADVPDIVWKKFASPHYNRKGEDIGVEGGRDIAFNPRSTGPEHPNHHCDADRPFDGRPTLLEACLGNPKLVNAADWNRYFNGFPKRVDVLHRGILPFRIWQIFTRMTEYAKNDPTSFLAAAGILAHYVGDASQPLHGSIHHDGVENEKPDVPRPSKTNKDKAAIRGDGIHGAFETDMISWAARKGVLFAEITQNLRGDHGMDLVSSGQEAALAAIKCMHEAARILPPRRTIDAYERILASGSRSRTEQLWDSLHSETGRVMALGVNYLAMLWDAAWLAGQGKNHPGRVSEAELKSRYVNRNFLKSVTIEEIEAEITNPSAVAFV
jgi:hypothetical protein